MEILLVIFHLAWHSMYVYLKTIKWQEITTIYSFFPDEQLKDQAVIHYSITLRQILFLKETL